MWRVAARCLVAAACLSLAACLPSLPGLVSPTPLSSVQPVELSPSAQPASRLSPSPSAQAPSATPVSTYTPTYTPIPTLTATGAGAVTTTATATAVSPSPTQLTASATAGESISLDKLPRDTVYKHVGVENRSRSQMDISLHCTTIHGLQTVLEYSNVKRLSLQAPEGDYVYVVYVGGRQIVGSFSLLHVPSVTITVYSDRVTIH
jgi:hypothetical protein